MDTVKFTHMEDGTKEDYEVLFRDFGDEPKMIVPEVLGYLEKLRGSGSAFQVNRLEHSLQTATLAYRDEADEEMVVAALIHDIGDFFAPMNHGDFAASIIKPYVSEQTYWVVKYHPVFQSLLLRPPHRPRPERAGQIPRSSALSSGRRFLPGVGSSRVRPRL